MNNIFNLSSVQRYTQKYSDKYIIMIVESTIWGLMWARFCFVNYFSLTKFMTMNIMYVVRNVILRDKYMNVKSIQQYNQENPRMSLNFRLLQTISNLVFTSDYITYVKACFGCAMIIAKYCN